jgi:hypothetical protein
VSWTSEGAAAALRCSLCEAREEHDAEAGGGRLLGVATKTQLDFGNVGLWKPVRGQALLGFWEK